MAPPVPLISILVFLLVTSYPWLTAFPRTQQRPTSRCAPEMRCCGGIPVLGMGTPRESWSPRAEKKKTLTFKTGSIYSSPGWGHTKDIQSLHKGLRNYLAARTAQKISNDLQDLPPSRPRSRKLSCREVPELQAGKPRTGLCYSHYSSVWRCCLGSPQVSRESPLLKSQRYRARGCRYSQELQARSTASSPPCKPPSTPALRTSRPGDHPHILKLDML